MDFVANYAKKEVEVEELDNQRGNDYLSFIVRLSFVIGSFKLGDSYKVVGVMLEEEWTDYQGKRER